MADINKIILELEVKEGNIKQRIESLNESIKKATQGSDSYEMSLKKLQQTEIQLAETSARLQTAKANLGNSMQKTSKAMQQTSDSTGAATSAALELARVVQDAPYGIRGMGNNITQLSSQLAFATKSAGSFSGALKQMWTAMMGPLGVVFAISAVVAVLDGMYGGMKKAKEATEETTEALKDQDDILTKIASSYLKFGKNKELNDYYSRALIQRSPKLKKILEDENKSQEEKNKAISDFVRLKELEIDNENRLIKLKELKVSLDEKEKEIRDKHSKNLAGARGTKAEVNFIKKINKEISDSTINTRNSIEESLSDYIAFSSEIQRLESILFPKEDKKDKKKDKRDRVKALFNLPTPAEVIAEAKKLLDAVSRAMNINLKDKPLTIEPKLNLELSDEAKARIAQYNENLNKELTLDRKLDNFSEYADLAKRALTSISDFTNAQYDRDLTIERNQTNALNDELNSRLLNENLSKEERAKIQNEIYRNDEASRIRQNEIKKKQFNSQKAFNIASALIDTGRAAAGVMADARGGFFARLAQAIPTIAFGLAQVATIASQKFQPEASTRPIRTSGGGGSSGGGVGNRTFDFNLVGNNKENQLANAIQGKFDQPLKAYVVSRDMSNQQQLDANIVNSARF